MLYSVLCQTALVLMDLQLQALCHLFQPTLKSSQTPNVKMDKEICQHNDCMIEHNEEMIQCYKYRKS